jgi:hypothetical protein
MPKVVTANTLDTGTVVFLGPAGAWVGAIAEAALYEDAAAAEAALAGAGLANVVVDAFVTDAGPEQDGRPKMTLRDTIRAFGPTINFLPSAPKRA